MQDPYDHPEPARTSLRATGAADHPHALDEVALDLVRAATDEGDDALIRTLLRASVGLGMTSAATFWTLSKDGARWEQRRGFGGTTPEPNHGLSWAETDGCPGAPPTGGAHETGVTFRFGVGGAIVTLAEAFDRDGERDSREEGLEALILLAETLLGQEFHDGEFFESNGPSPGIRGLVSGPLPAAAPDQRNRHHTG